MRNLFMEFFSIHAFIVSASIAMFVHTTWAFNTLFSGPQPENPLSFGLWLIPGALMALSIDIGQIKTAQRIRETHARRRWLIATFLSFAVFGYYLQWFHLSHHFPLLQLGEGISATHQPLVLTLRDLAIWIVPLMFPASTILYAANNVIEVESRAERAKYQELEPLQPNPTSARSSENGRNVKSGIANTVE